MVKSILNGVTMGSVHWAKVHDPAVVEGDCSLEQEVHVTAGHAHLYKCMLLIGLKPRKRTQCWAKCWIWLKAQTEDRFKGTSCAEHTSSKECKILLHKLAELHGSSRSFVSVLNAQRWDWRIFYSLWSPRPIGLLPWMGVIEMWGIRGMTIPHLCCGSISGGQAWPMRCSSQLSPVHIACNMRAMCPKHPYTQLWPPLLWTSYM